MKNYSEERITVLMQKAFSVAEERFGKSLSVSPADLDYLDEILSKITKLLQQHPLEANKVAKDISFSFGALLGEIVRREVGGEWVIDEGKDIPYLFVDGVRIFPMEYVWQRLHRKARWTAKEFYARSKSSGKKKPRPLTTVTTQRSTTGKQRRTQKNESKSTNWKALSIWGVIGILFFIFVGGGMWLGISNYRSRQRFRRSLEGFIREGDKLNYMTEEGVSYSQFKQQLVEVKTAYSAVGNKWPSSLSSARVSFDRAIEGWDLAVEAWDIKINPPVLGTKDFKNRVAQYLGMEPDSMRLGWWLATDDIIGVLMGQASQYYEQGKDDTNHYLGK